MIKAISSQHPTTYFRSATCRSHALSLPARVIGSYLRLLLCFGASTHGLIYVLAIVTDDSGTAVDHPAHVVIGSWRQISTTKIL